MCSVEGCEKTTHAKGLCQAHYRRLQRYGDPLAKGRPGPPRRAESTDHRKLSSEDKARRAEKRAAVKCRFCGYDFAPSTPPPVA